MSDEYAGDPRRLAYDGRRHVHVDEATGRDVVTDDGGETWRYREDGDPSHRDRYEGAGGQLPPLEDEAGGNITIHTGGDPLA